MKRCSTSLVVKEMPIKSTTKVSLHTRYGGYYQKKKREITQAVEDAEKLGLLCTVGGSAKLLLRKTAWRFLRKSRPELCYDPAISPVGASPKEVEAGSQSGVCPPCHSSLIHNSQGWKRP